MTKTLDEVVLTRPDPAPDAGPLDDRLYDLVAQRVRRVIRDNPLYGTHLGIHTEDGRLGDGSRDAVLAEVEAERAHLAAVEALGDEGLSPAARFERDLEVHNVRRSLFDAEVVRTWERRSTALDTIGDGLFLLLARDFAPLAERLESITGRLEEVPGFLDASRTRATVPQVRIWQQTEIDSARSLPSLFRELRAAAETTLAAPELRRFQQAADRAATAIDAYTAHLRETLASGTDDWALGRERYDELIAHRAFDGLTADEILEIGREQLSEHRRLRREAAHEIDPDADEPSVIDRVKRDHPATFKEALDAYRDAMLRARAFLIEHDLVTVPESERLDVIPTPEYLRAVNPFAAYFSPPKFDPEPRGIYIVTPSVSNEPGAMREHNYGSISNTSIHEAYPGHHLQLHVANQHPSLTRLLTDAPEFVEGWGMYSEQLMREHGFDDAPHFRLTMHTDAIWRAARIVLDIRMHRGQLSVEEAVDYLVEHTAFEEANARAEVRRYTYTPSYQLSYLLGKVLILGLRADEQRRLGDAFSMRAFHDALLRNGSIPVSFHRRLLTEAAAREGGGAGGARPLAAR